MGLDPLEYPLGPVNYPLGSGFGRMNAGIKGQGSNHAFAPFWACGRELLEAD